VNVSNNGKPPSALVNTHQKAIYRTARLLHRSVAERTNEGETMDGVSLSLLRSPNMCVDGTQSVNEKG